MLWLTPCEVLDPSSPFGDVNFLGNAGSIFGAIPGFGEIGGMLGLFDEIIGALQTDQNYTQKISECIKFMINEAIEADNLSDAKSTLAHILNELE